MPLHFKQPLTQSAKTYLIITIISKKTGKEEEVSFENTGRRGKYNSIMRDSISSLSMTAAVFAVVVANFGSAPAVHGFTLTSQTVSSSMVAVTRQSLVLGVAADDSSGGDPDEIVGKRIIVTGDVNGGYLRTCISNEAGKFRRLLGTMSPPDDGDEAEIYVEVSLKE